VVKFLGKQNSTNFCQIQQGLGYSYSPGTVSEFSTGVGSNPSDITVGGDGNLWFSEYKGLSNNSWIGTIRPNGTGFASYADGNLALATNTMYGVIAAPDGNIWFDDALSGKISYVSTAGTFSGTVWSMSSTSGGGVIVGPDNHVWSEQQLSNSEFGVDVAPSLSSQTVSNGWSQSNNSVRTLAVGSDGNVWMIAYNNLNLEKVVPGSGPPMTVSTSGSFSAGANPAEIISGPDGSLWVTEPGINKIASVTTAGVVTEYPAGGTPGSFVVTKDGSLWVSIGNSTLSQVNTSSGASRGTLTPHALSGIVGGIKEMVKGPDNNIWFTDYSGGYVGYIANSAC
jgi:virginiamycin B lyase